MKDEHKKKISTALKAYHACAKKAGCGKAKKLPKARMVKAKPRVKVRKKNLYSKTKVPRIEQPEKGKVKQARKVATRSEIKEKVPSKVGKFRKKADSKIRIRNYEAQQKIRAPTLFQSPIARPVDLGFLNMMNAAAEDREIEVEMMEWEGDEYAVDPDTMIIYNPETGEEIGEWFMRGGPKMSRQYPPTPEFGEDPYALHKALEF